MGTVRNSGRGGDPEPDQDFDMKACSHEQQRHNPGRVRLEKPVADHIIRESPQKLMKRHLNDGSRA